MALTKWNSGAGNIEYIGLTNEHQEYLELLKASPFWFAVFKRLVEELYCCLICLDPIIRALVSKGPNLYGRG